MKFLEIKEGMTLSSLIDRVGKQNAEQILAANNVPWTPNIYDAYMDTVSQHRQNGAVTFSLKQSWLNNLCTNSEAFEQAALLSEEDWNVLVGMGTLPNYLRIPENITISDGYDVLIDGSPVDETIYNKVMSQIELTGSVDPAIFEKYSNDYGVTASVDEAAVSNFSFAAFPIPWGDVQLYSWLSDEYCVFPGYPKELSDERTANYSTMPDMIYQYEPWQVYESSGPRSPTFEFDIHRDMWTGDHRDGCANALIRFCEAQCYPKYAGSAVYTPLVTLYVAGKPLISGVITNVQTHWEGPIGLDGWYLHCTLSLTIVEVSQTPLDYETVKNKPLIG